jgi:hypothetical protein
MGPIAALLHEDGVAKTVRIPTGLAANRFLGSSPVRQDWTPDRSQNNRPSNARTCRFRTLCQPHGSGWDEGLCTRTSMFGRLSCARSESR